jgi:hypothetical protein
MNEGHLLAVEPTPEEKNVLTKTAVGTDSPVVMLEESEESDTMLR